MKKSFNDKKEKTKKSESKAAKMQRKIHDKYLKAIKKLEKKNPDFGFE